MHTAVTSCRLVGLSPALVTPRGREKRPGERNIPSCPHHPSVGRWLLALTCMLWGPSGGSGCQGLHGARKPQRAPAWPRVAEILFSNGNVVFQLQKEMGKDVCVHACVSVCVRAMPCVHCAQDSICVCTWRFVTVSRPPDSSLSPSSASAPLPFSAGSSAFHSLPRDTPAWVLCFPGAMPTSRECGAPCLSAGWGLCRAAECLSVSPSPLGYTEPPMDRCG